MPSGHFYCAVVGESVLAPAPVFSLRHKAAKPAESAARHAQAYDEHVRTGVPDMAGTI
ncbi:hypothetical protein OKW49_007892 [Paraburkholderia youngii]